MICCVECFPSHPVRPSKSTVFIPNIQLRAKATNRHSDIPFETANRIIYCLRCCPDSSSSTSTLHRVENIFISFKRGRAMSHMDDNQLHKLCPPATTTTRRRRNKGSCFVLRVAATGNRSSSGKGRIVYYRWWCCNFFFSCYFLVLLICSSPAVDCR